MTTQLTLALDQPIAAYWLECVLKSRHADILKLGLWSLLKPLDDGASYAKLAQTLCAQLKIPIFWDLKLADTPDTNRRVIAALPQGGYVTISTILYSSANLRMMTNLCHEGMITPVAVPITSATERQPLLPNITRQGFFLSELARTMDCGFKHVVCDGSLLTHLKDASVHAHVPGVRPAWYPQAHNHQHTIEPGDAVRLGAHNVIVGRPIFEQSTLRDVLYYLEMARHEIDSAASSTT